MPNTVIQILRSYANTTPLTLQDGELAYSFVSNTLFIGNTNNSVINVGGQFYTSQIDNATSAATGSTLVKRDASGNASFNFITGNVIGTIIGNANSATQLQTARNFSIDGGDITAGTISFNGTGDVILNASLDAVPSLGAGTYGSQTEIPIIVVAANGRVMNVTTQSLSTTLSTAADSGTGSVNLLNGTLNFVGGEGITTSDAGNTVTFNVDNTVVRANAFTGDTQTINTNLTIGSNKDLTVTGNLFITGNISVQNVQSLEVADPLILLGVGNYYTDTKDIGFASHYNDGQNAHTGLVRDAGTKDYHFFQGYTGELDANNNINLSDPSYRSANTVASYFKGNLIATTVNANTIDTTGNVSVGGNLVVIGDILGMNVAQNTRLTAAESSITIIQGVDVTQNTLINAVNAYSHSAYSTANSALNSTVYLQGALDSANANIVFLATNTSPNIYTTSVSPSVNSIAVGGAPIQNAAVWSTFTMTQVFDAILFPTLGPTYTIPTITLTANNTGTLEIGRTINQLLTVTGTKNDANAFTQLRISRNGTVINTINSPPATATTNIVAQYGYADPNNPNFFYANTYIDSNTIVSGTTTYQGIGNYDAGLAKRTNKGTVDANTFAIRSTTNPQSAASNFASTSSTITGIHPYFWGVSSTQPTAASIATSIQAGTVNKVLAVGSGTLTITYNASSQYVFLAVQTAYAAKTAWFNTALNNGSIGAGQFILSPVTQAVNSPDAFWSGVSYRIYISGFATTTSGSIQFS